MLWIGATALAAEGPIFLDRTTELGVDFQHQSGKSGELYFVEMMGVGGALLDYDNDGDLDLYLVQGNQLGKPADPSLKDRLYRNDLVKKDSKKGSLKFVDVTDEVGLNVSGYGMGVATGDFDNDGWTDLYVTHFGGNQLLRNNEGVFIDVTGGTGTGDTTWSIAASFVDLDNDGWLDLYVGNYVNFTVTDHKFCPSPAGGRDYCGPLAYDPLPDRLFLNRGGGSGGVKFDEVASRAGLNEPSSSMGAVTGDYDGNGLTDLYVTNDAMANQLWLGQRPKAATGGKNAGRLSFFDEALLAGCAFNLDGQPEGSMGVASGDVDGDGLEDLFVTHLVHETNTLYLNRGKTGEAAFLDTTLKSGLGTPSWLYTGFGVALLDYDNDGLLDILVANGAVRLFDSDIFEAEKTVARSLNQPNQLWRGRGGGRFDEVTDQAGAAFRLSEVSRGISRGDLDNDGDLDVVIHNNHGPARILINRVGQEAGWLGVRLVGGPAEPRDMLGAQAWLLGGPNPSPRRVHSDGSYASASDPRIVFGLGAIAGGSATVRVRWPGGHLEDFPQTQTGRYTVLREGQGRAVRK